MAKYDYGGGCPCGLYSECKTTCENHPDKQKVKWVIYDKIIDAEKSHDLSYMKAVYDELEEMKNHEDFRTLGVEMLYLQFQSKILRLMTKG